MSTDWTSFRALGDRIIVRRTKAEEQTPGGIHLPDVALENQPTGVVISIGSRFSDRILRVGDTVLFSRHGGVAEGDNFVILFQQEVLAYQPTALMHDKKKVEADTSTPGSFGFRSKSTAPKARRASWVKRKKLA